MKFEYKPSYSNGWSLFACKDLGGERKVYWYIDHVYIFWHSKEHPGCVSWIDSTLSSMRNISVHLILIKRKKRKRNKKYSVYNFSEHVQHCETFRQHKLNPSWNEASKLLNFRNYLSHKIVTHASLTNFQK